MKNLRIAAITFILSGCHLISNAQSKTDVGIHFGLSGNALHRFQSIDGGGSGEGRLSYLAGLWVGHGLTERLRLVSGLDFARHNLMMVSAPMPGQRSTDGRITTLSLPLGIEWKIGRWFFIHGGPSLDIQPENWEYVDNQDGIGLSAGIGGRYTWGGWSLSLIPSVKQYALIPFGNGKYRQRLMTAGAALSVGYGF